MNWEDTMSFPTPRLRRQDIPARILVVDDDDLEASLMSDRLGAVGLEVTVARNGVEALERLAADWFPLILADWQMPQMDGIALVREVRARGVEDSYFIMLSARAAAEDFERGYAAGVDDYLSKKTPDVDLMARIEAGLNMVSLRRSLREAQAALAERGSQVANADARLQFVAHLRSELTRARRYGRVMSLMVISLQGGDVTEADYFAVTRAVRGITRFDIDWAEALLEPGKPSSIAVVLPEASAADLESIRRRVRVGLVKAWDQYAAGRLAPSVVIGAAAYEPQGDGPAPTAEEMLRAAEECGGCMASDGDRQLVAVQTSSASQLIVPCRCDRAAEGRCIEITARAVESSVALN